MPKVVEGDLAPIPHLKYAIVVSRYNENVTGKLLAGALETFAKHGVRDEDVDVAWVPGAWELPLAAQTLAKNGGCAAVVCLGAVIKGETTHDEHINRAVSESLARISLQTGKPIAFGLLTCNTMEQAIHRAGGNVGNKGIECAEAALRMVDLLPKIDRGVPF